MICLTGDLHHTSLGTGNQKHCDKTEIQVARHYLELLEKANVKVTFFISGLSFVEEWEDVKPIVEHPLVELGGHNWSCLEPSWWHRASHKLLRNYNGPAWYQRFDAERTIDEIAQKTGRIVRIWRNHMYMHGRHTESALAEAGIEICSDGVKKNSRGPEWHKGGVWNFPINILPDHEHLYHAERTPEWVAAWQKRYRWSDDFGADSYFIDEWVDRVLEQLRENEARNTMSNMIVHPITMYLCDRFDGFKRILEFVAAHQTVHVTEAVHAAKQLRYQEP